MARKEVQKEARQTRWLTVGFGAALILIGLCGFAASLLSKDLLPAIGGTFLGAVIGMLVGFYAQEAEVWSRQAMTASVAVLTGAGAVALLRYNAADPASVWFYPIGLVTGFGFGTIWSDVDVEEDEEEG
ncbi:hypothetical protein [Bradyrhizobium sp. CCBAU 45384]|uniref:hypothetical protein n=1 Tax=Bradyrhizobium sp. CCBAU 45384 TaxID=858428 RepID=UPI0023069DB2|nr:hypothetical protein [Bradyrhizobium sp. CCBAU 45384]MDA9410588.1 hypothetical protein [Bradyrhizobium sp. CCBAU 45384]